MSLFSSCDRVMSYDQHCSYCGSISVEKAVDALKTPGTKFSGSDWKYGYPHKFYIDVVNPKAEEVVEVGCDSRLVDGVRVDTPIMGTRPHLHYKFYSEHLLHVAEGVFSEFNILSKECFDIVWDRNEKGLGYYCKPGVQLWGIIRADGTPEHGIL